MVLAKVLSLSVYGVSIHEIRILGLYNATKNVV